MIDEHTSVDEVARKRIAEIEKLISTYFVKMQQSDKAIRENTDITLSIRDNTDEIIEAVKILKKIGKFFATVMMLLQKFIVWGSPIAAAGYAVYEFLKGKP